VNRAIRTGGFKNLMVVADEGTGPDDRRLETLAKKLDAEWKPTGVNVYYITAHEMRPGQGMTFNADYLRRWAGRTVPDVATPLAAALAPRNRSGPARGAVGTCVSGGGASDGCRVRAWLSHRAYWRTTKCAT